MFQDDVLRVADSVLSARAGKIKIDSMVKAKQLKLKAGLFYFLDHGLQLS